MKMTENEITEKIIGCDIKVHKALGPGLLESAHEECLYYELCKTAINVLKLTDGLRRVVNKF